MSGPVRLYFAAIALVAIVSAKTHAEEREISYVRQDGGQLIKISVPSNTFRFAEPGSDSGDLGGVIRDCSTTNVRCVSLSGYLLAAPKGNIPENWLAGGGKFSVVGRTGHNHLSLLIKVSVKGDPYMFFSYSVQHGVESISLQREGAGQDLAKTYFLDGDRGLLAGP